jgi:hypothetical protein
MYSKVAIAALLEVQAGAQVRQVGVSAGVGDFGAGLEGSVEFVPFEGQGERFDLVPRGASKRNVF